MCKVASYSDRHPSARAGLGAWDRREIDFVFGEELLEVAGAIRYYDLEADPEPVRKQVC